MGRMVELMNGAGLAESTISIGVFLSLAFGMVAGHKAHRWLWYYAPGLGRLLPSDAGALLGLACAMAALAA